MYRMTHDRKMHAKTNVMQDMTDYWNDILKMSVPHDRGQVKVKVFSDSICSQTEA